MKTTVLPTIKKGQPANIIRVLLSPHNHSIKSSLLQIRHFVNFTLHFEKYFSQCTPAFKDLDFFSDELHFCKDLEFLHIN